MPPNVADIMSKLKPVYEDVAKSELVDGFAK